MAAIILTLLAVGIYMSEFLPKDAPNRMEIYNLHKSLGVIALVLIFFRIINRFIYKAPALPQSISKLEITLAHLAHFGLYFLMIIAPLSGYLMSNSFGYPAVFFGYELPFLIEKNVELGKFFAETHEVSTYSLLGLITLHISAVIKHRFFDKPENDVLKRMV
jgi:cytochrome b561